MKKIEFITAKLANDGTITKDEMAAILTAVFILKDDLDNGTLSRMNPIANGINSLNRESNFYGLPSLLHGNENENPLY